MKILILNVCKERLHYFEFVKPIEDILKKNHIKFFTVHYKNLKRNDLNLSSKIIICGTSLKDNDFLNNLNFFQWILSINKPVLGICAGMQIIGLIFGGKLKRKIEIGYYKETFKKEFLGLVGEKEVYHLHNYYIAINKGIFEIFSETKTYKNRIIQAFKHKQKDIYGVLFHPEVRNKEVILNFIKI